MATDGLQHAHRVGVLRHEREGLDQLGGNGARGDQLERHAVELGGLGQLAVPEEIADLLEARPPRQLVDVVAAVGEPAVLAVEVAERGLGRDDTLEAADELGPFGHGITPLDGLAPDARTVYLPPPRAQGGRRAAKRDDVRGAWSAPFGDGPRPRRRGRVGIGGWLLPAVADRTTHPRGRSHAWSAGSRSVGRREWVTGPIPAARGRVTRRLACASSNTELCDQIPQARSERAKRRIVVSWRRAVRVGPGESCSELGEAPGIL